MSEIHELKASPRPRVGKGSARAARREGLTPGVIYGEKQPSESIAMDTRVLTRLFQAGHFLTTLCDIEVDGRKTRVIPRDVQLDPVRDLPLHVDFLRLSKDSKIAVDIPVHFINEEAAPGIKRGGVLNIVRHEVELLCPADSIPDEIVVDLTGLDIGDSVHISAVLLPEGCTPTITTRDFTVATIAAPAGMPSDEAPSTAPASGEAAAGAPEGAAKKEE